MHQLKRIVITDSFTIDWFTSTFTRGTTSGRPPSRPPRTTRTPSSTSSPVPFQRLPASRSPCHKFPSCGSGKDIKLKLLSAIYFDKFVLFSQVHLVDMDGDARPFWLPLSRHVFQWVPRLSSHEAILYLIVVPEGAHLSLLLIAGFIHALAFWVSGTGSTERIKILRTPSRATGTSGKNSWKFLA